MNPGFLKLKDNTYYNYSLRVCIVCIYLVLVLDIYK